MTSEPTVISNIVNEAQQGKVDAVREWLLADGKDNVDKQKMVLYTAAACGHADICQLIVDNERVTAFDMIPALRNACFTCKQPVVKLLIDKLGHHFDTQMRSDLLHFAVLQCNAEMIDWLLTVTGLTAADAMAWQLVAASARGDLTAVTQAVNDTAVVTDVMSHALWVACYGGKADVVEWLMKNTSADVNHRRHICIDYQDIMTSLAAACHEGHMSIVARLLTSATPACDVNIVSSRKCNSVLHEVIWTCEFTPLHKFCNENDEAAAAQAYDLIESDLNKQDSTGATPLHVACLNGHGNVTRMLMSVFPNLEITDDFGDTPVEICEKYGSADLANYIRNIMYTSFDDSLRPNINVV